MGKKGSFQPTEKYKNYLLPTSKPIKSHAFYQEKVPTLQDQINKKLKKITELLEGLYLDTTNGFIKNIKAVIEKNLGKLIADLDLLHNSFLKDSYSFNTDKLKVNQHCITEMKNLCDNLQTVSSYEREFKRLSKIKHALHELEHLIQPTSLEKSLEEKPRVKRKPKTVSTKRPISKTAKKKLPKSKSDTKLSQKSKKPAQKLKKITKSKTK